MPFDYVQALKLINAKFVASTLAGSTFFFLFNSSLKFHLVCCQILQKVAQNPFYLWLSHLNSQLVASPLAAAVQHWSACPGTGQVYHCAAKCESEHPFLNARQSSKARGARAGKGGGVRGVLELFRTGHLCNGVTHFQSRHTVVATKLKLKLTRERALWEGRGRGYANVRNHRSLSLLLTAATALCCLPLLT